MYIRIRVSGKGLNKSPSTLYTFTNKARVSKRRVLNRNLLSFIHFKSGGSVKLYLIVQLAAL